MVPIESIVHCPPIFQGNQAILVKSFEQCKSMASILGELHERVCLKPVSPMEVNMATIHEAISCWTTYSVATTISQSLQTHFQTTNAKITGFRASVVYSFTTDECFWPVIEWKENDDTEVLAIFYIDENEPEICSWLIHSGSGIRTEGTGRWNRTFVSWNVTEISHLKSLFGAAQHLLGLLGWSAEDLLNLYYQVEEEEDCNVEKYFP
jgi:hypothetical protein